MVVYSQKRFIIYQEQAKTALIRSDLLLKRPFLQQNGNFGDIRNLIAVNLYCWVSAHTFLILESLFVKNRLKLLVFVVVLTS